MKRKKQLNLPLNNQFVIGALFGVIAIIAIILTSRIITDSSSIENATQVYSKRGGGGKTEGDYESSLFNLPENASTSLLNTSFEINIDDVVLVPDGWLYHFDQPNRNTGVDCNVARTGNCSYYINGKKNSIIKQFVDLPGKTGDIITVSGWGKGENIGTSTGRSDGLFWVQAWIHYEDGTTQHDVLQKLPNGTYDFTKAEASFAARKPFLGVTVFLRFDGTGEAWFDDISLTKTPA